MPPATKNTAPIDPHVKPLETVTAKARMAMILMLFASERSACIIDLDNTVRCVRRRWDQLVPPNAAERKSFHADLLKDRQSWDGWFQRFINGAGTTIEELNEHIRIVNAARRSGVNDSKPINYYKSSVASRSIVEAPAVASGNSIAAVKEDDEIRDLQRQLEEKLKLRGQINKTNGERQPQNVPSYRDIFAQAKVDDVSATVPHRVGVGQMAVPPPPPPPPVEQTFTDQQQSID